MKLTVWLFISSLVLRLSCPLATHSSSFLTISWINDVPLPDTGNDQLQCNASHDSGHSKWHFLLAILKLSAATQALGYLNLTSEQIEAIVHFVKGQDISLPTGAGKSLCYTLLSIVFDALCPKSSGHSIVVIVSPINTLIQDQVTKYSSKGAYLTRGSQCKEV